MAPRQNSHARPELKARIIQLNGSQMGYLPFVAGMLPVATQHKAVGVDFIKMVLNAARPAPAWMVAGLTRIAEDNLELSRDDAYARSSAWFTIKEAPSE